MKRFGALWAIMGFFVGAGTAGYLTRMWYLPLTVPCDFVPLRSGKGQKIETKIESNTYGDFAVLSRPEQDQFIKGYLATAEYYNFTFHDCLAKKFGSADAPGRKHLDKLVELFNQSRDDPAHDRWHIYEGLKSEPSLTHVVQESYELCVPDLIGIRKK